MDILKLYGPFFCSLVLLVASLRAGFGDEAILTIQKYGFDFVVTKTIAGRVAFIVGALSFFSYYLYMDYSQFFPSHFEMEVFYDDEGIEKSLNVFTQEELSQLGYTGRNKSLIASYYQSLDNKLREILSYEGFFSIEDGVVHSEGETSFKVTQTMGIHNYYITESKGQLTHILDAPRRPKIEFLSFFEKIPSSTDYIRPSFGQIVFDQELIVSPRFKQIIAEKNKSDGVIFDHTLIGVTKIYLLPYPNFSNTVYFYDAQEKGIIPIGYAVYK